MFISYMVCLHILNLNINLLHLGYFCFFTLQLFVVDLLIEANFDIFSLKKILFTFGKAPVSVYHLAF